MFLSMRSELDIKEALVIKQKGETTTTQLQDEIQGLRYVQRLIKIAICLKFK